MELLLVIVAAGLVQICFSASIVKTDTNSKYFTNEDIDDIRTTLKASPDMDPQAVDNFANTLYGFREKATDAEFVESFINLLSLAVNVDVSNALSKTIFPSNENDERASEGTSQNSMSSSEKFSKNGLKKLEEALSKDKLTQTQIQQVINFAQALFPDTEPEDGANAVKTLFFLAARNSMRTKPKSKTS